MTIRLAMPSDLPFINEVMNHPKVRPHVWPGTDPIDCATALELMWTLVAPGKGVMMAEALGGNNYLALVAFLPDHWGMEAVVAMRQGIRLIFTNTDCHRLYASVKPGNIRASRNLVAMGLKDVGLHGNRVTGYVEYTDLLDESLFKETCLSGWPGKALYWWGIKAKIEDIPDFIPLDVEKPVFALDGVVYDYLA